MPQLTPLGEAKLKFGGGFITNKLLDWVFSDMGAPLSRPATRQQAIERLEEVNCASGTGPAPLLYSDMARELAEHWREVNEALEDYRSNVGEPWDSKDRVLENLWFAYEYFAQVLVEALKTESKEGNNP